MSTNSYKISGLDCAEEVAILRRVVGPLAGGEDRLTFNLLDGRMNVDCSACGDIGAAIVESVAKTGMRAVPWGEHTAPGGNGESPSFLAQHGKAVACALSGILMLSGFLVQGLISGWGETISGDGGTEGIPALAIGLYILAAISGAWFVVPRAMYSARSLRPDMNLLMTLAVIGACILGEWFEAASVAFLFAVALLLETWSVGRARRAIGALMDLSPKTARFRCPHDGCIEEKPVGEVNVGVTVIVRPGEKIPLDGTVRVGATSVNEAPITGESMPVEKGVGDTVFAGTLNNDGAFEFEVTKRADDTTLARILHLVEDAQSRRAKSEQWVEAFARRYTPAMMGLAVAVVAVSWLVLGRSFAESFYQGLVVLVIACPCALVISTPVSIVAGLARAARAGVLIKGGAYLEAPARLRAIAIDKTGTITEGRPRVQAIVPLNGHTETELLSRAAALESHSEHPLAKAVLDMAKARGVSFEPATDFRILPGKGAEAGFDGRQFWIGSHRFLHERGQETAEGHDRALALEDEGHSVIAIGNAEHMCGLMSVADSVRPEARAAIKALRDSGVEHIVMLTGDNEGTARAISKAAGVDAYRSELLPEDKAAAISELVREYGQVAMVGDGVNDAPAMATATLGIAMGAAGSDAAIETADIALMSDDLSKLPWLIGHSRRVVRTIRTNIAFALGLKVAFIALAFAGAATLWMAIAADMGASLLVIANALRLLRD